jgi:L-rhamnose isomerase
LFGIGSESYVVGSHEFYMGYAMKNEKMVCLDVGHFHPTETISDKISSLLTFSDEILLHLSRGVRWDSDHVIVQSDDLYSIMQEITRCDAWDNVHVALDFFDASINRVAAWVIGTRAALKAACAALLEPATQLKTFECENNFTSRLALTEELRNLPYGAVFNKYCLDNGVDAGAGWLSRLNDYEKNVLCKRK